MKRCNTALFKATCVVKVPRVRVSPAGIHKEVCGTTATGALYCRFDQSASDPFSAMAGIHSHVVNPGTQARQGWDEREYQETDDLPDPFSHKYVEGRAFAKT
jgi:hypothetical protein